MAENQNCAECRRRVHGNDVIWAEQGTWGLLACHGWPRPADARPYCDDCFYSQRSRPPSEWSRSEEWALRF